MKFFYALFVCCFLFISCKKEGELSIKIENIPLEKCNDCPKVTISVPVVEDNDAINTEIEKAVVSILSYGELNDATTYQEAVTAFNNEYLDLKKEFPEDLLEYEAMVDGNVTYETPILLCVKLNSYLYTGGAHGYNAITFLNFDKRTGERLENWELFNNIDAFAAFAEKKFRIQEKIPANSSINATGFMFDGEAFSLPDAIGFSNDGIVLLYNQYEIASYADGQKTLVIPYNEITAFFKYNSQ